MNIRDIDLNLLVIFRSLMATLSVSETAKQLNLSQPAVSHALGRLRRDLGDELLVRSSRAMVATPYAKEISQRLIDLLGELEGVLIRKSFAPEAAKAEIRIQSTEYFEQLVMPKLLERLAREAPGIRLINTATRGMLPRAELAEGSCEIAIAGFFGELPEGFFQQEVFTDRLVCLCSKGRKEKIGGKISLDDYLDLKHVFISPEGRLGGGAVDDLLAKRKKKRQVVASISGFSAPAWICGSKDYGCTLPRKLAALYSEILPVKWLELPFETAPIRVVQVWHERTQRDPLYRYIRATIREICDEI